MLNPQVHHQSQSIRTLCPLPKPFLRGNGQAFRPAQLNPSFKKASKIGVGFSPSNNSIKAIFNLTEKSTKVKAVITVKPIIPDPLALSSLVGALGLELVSAELDPKTGEEKPTIKGLALGVLGKDDDGNIKYKAELKIPASFGDVGAILVESDQLTEMYLQDIVLDGLPNGPVNLTCDSWIQPKIVDKQKRIFFTNKSYLPSQTPNGLKRLRAEELNNLQGDGQGERKRHERIYDYDVYNDLALPEIKELARPVLDPASESRSVSIYVPRDEAFADIKLGQFSASSLYSGLHALVPFLEAILIDKDLGFSSLSDIDKVFNEGIELPPELKDQPLWQKILPILFKTVSNTGKEIEGSTLYGSRALFFLNPDGTLRPLAIELTRPPLDGKPQWKQVFTPTNRKLSAMHPINRLLKPHFRYTMEINAKARLILVNAGGLVETTFFPGKYSMEFSSVIYDKQWRFDHEALPKDLISRGMAVEDPNAPHGLKLTIEDYPFANDGLDLWDALKQWVTEYVNHYYTDPSLVESDEELQAWWTEIRTVGHADKKDEPWWPVLKTPQDLIEIVTTIAWVASGQHAAVNFGQYLYGGYFPNRPTMSRTNMPTEDQSEADWKSFLANPEDTLLQCFPSKMQAMQDMVILDTLSTHSPDEEYLGKEMEPAWGDDPVIKAAFEKFNRKMQELEGIIDDRNSNENLRNRTGAGIVPYELLKPFSGPGATGKGVPYSISI
ncbi:hypothetical protein WN943_009514 [Citrus x changshan-huyou]